MRPSAALWVCGASLFSIALMPDAARASNCDVTSVGFTPVDDLGAGLYLGQFQGGLYPGGSNAVPGQHHDVGVTRAADVQPLDTAGNPSPSGKYVLLSIGMSNTTQEFCSQGSAEPCDAWTFMGQAAADARVNHTTLAVINGAAGGQDAATWDSPTDSNYDRVRDQRLVPKGLTEAQVQVLWVKEADKSPSVQLPNSNADAYTLESRLGSIMRAAKVRYPNLRIAFLSSRIYAGYATGVSTLNPEPYSYESAFSAKWLIEAQINQMGGGPSNPTAGNMDYNTVVPWVAWGPYLWADGLTPRSDGLTWQCSDLDNDGTHPAQSGEQKVGTMLLNFLLDSPFSSPWFRGTPSSGSRSVTQWRSMRDHTGVGGLPIVLNPTATGNGGTGPRVETRQNSIQFVLVDFNGTAALANAGDVQVTGWHTSADGVLGSPASFTPTSVYMTDADTLAIAFSAGLLPNNSCYRIVLGAGLIAEGLTGDTDVYVRSLLGDTNMSGDISQSDILFTKSKVGQPVNAAGNPQHDVNLSGSITFSDVLLVKSRLTSPTHRALCP